MWTSVAKMLQRKGYDATKLKVDIQSTKDSASTSLQLPVCKITNYKQPSRDKGNATLPVEVQGIKTMEILDTGVE